ncbi:MAG: helix-turn-helix domain-containing protein [Roseiarcus sp.]
MNRTTWLQERRMLKFRDVLSRWEASELSALEASELLGMSERQFRRYRGRFEDQGEAGLLDRRLGKASPRRVLRERSAADAGFVPGDVSGLGRPAFSRAVAQPSWVFVGLQLDEDAAAASGICRAHRQTRSAQAQTRAQTVCGDDAAPRRFARALAGGRAAVGPDRDDG